MDPYSAEGELINIHSAFHQGQYEQVVDFDISSLSAENEIPARVLILRARIALGQAEDVLADVQGETSEPEFAAVAALAQSALGQTDEAVEVIEELAQSAGDNQTVQVLGGIVLQAAGKSDEALALLSKHSGSREYFHTQPLSLDYILARSFVWSHWIVANA
jgi:coatomer subunit epsilon